MTEPTDDEFSELYDADIARVDLVGKAANGTRFLIAKSDGLVDPDTVRELIGDTPDAPISKSERDDITMTGSPAAIAAMIHAAPVRKETPVTQPDPTVAKADVTDPTEPLPDADTVADDAGVTVDGDPDDPSSPAWEAVDAATAQKAIDLAVGLKRLMEQSRDRENIEAAATGDMDDMDNVFDLSDALCALDCIVSILAPFAVGEQAEAEERQAALAKGQVLKAGRALSSKNEDRIRQAQQLLGDVLSSLPAPTADDGQPVAKEKETEMTDVADAINDLSKAGEAAQAATGALAAAENEALSKAVDELAHAVLAKAKGDPQMAVYDANGKLVGTIDGSDLNPIASTEPPAGGEKEPAENEPTPAQTAAPAAADPDSGAVIPGTSTVAAPAPNPDDETAVTKAATAGARAALEEVLPMLTDKLGGNAETETIIKALQERVEELAKAIPDDRKSPRLNGASGTAGLVARDPSTEDGDQFADLRKAVEEADTPSSKLAAQQQLSYAEIKARFAR